MLRSRLRRWCGERAAVRPSGRAWPAWRGPRPADSGAWPARGRTWPARLGPRLRRRPSRRCPLRWRHRPGPPVLGRGRWL